MNIYKITNLNNNKIYVGKEMKADINYFGSGVLINRSLKKYGMENFRKDIIEKCSADNVNAREMFWINELNSLSPSGYNIALGGDGGDTMSRHPYKNEIYKNINHSGLKNVNCKKCGKRMIVHKHSRLYLCEECIDKINTHICINCHSTFKTNFGKRQRDSKYCTPLCQSVYMKKHPKKRCFTLEHRQNLSKAMKKAHRNASDLCLI